MKSKKELELSLIEDRLFNQADKFQLLKYVSESKYVNDLAILVAMRLDKDEWGNYSTIASEIVRSVGLFPYLIEGRDVSLSSDMTKEYHKSLTRGAYFHKAQKSVLSRLLRGNSVILSAPTSFGKTFIVEELLLSKKYQNVMIVVPTIALIEEIRRKVKDLGIPHNRVSFTNQKFSDQNIFILTQERAHEILSRIKNEIGELDLLIIDEFYKIDKNLLSKNESSSRSDLLSVVYREYSNISKQLYLLGPYLNKANGFDTQRHEPIWIKYDNHITYQEIIRKKADKMNTRGEQTRKIVESEENDVLVYCSSPDQVRKLFKNHLSDIFESNSKNDDLISWVSANIADSWYLVDALKMGIGIHHGRLPRFLSQEIIRRFSDGRIRVLLCTSTIIEGVNTSAKSVVIYNNSRAFSKGYLTFMNIAGRAGRMFKHFFGRVYCFEIPSSADQVEVNDPIGVNENNENLSLLNLLDDTLLTKKQKTDVEEYRAETLIPIELQKQNHFIEIELQEKTIGDLRNTDLEQINLLRGPELSREQIIYLYKLVGSLGYNIASKVKSGNIDKGCYRAAVLTQSFFAEGIKGLAKSMNREHAINDDSIEEAFNFTRNVIGYDIPRYLRALNRLIEYVFGEEYSGSLEPFSNRLEFLNTEPVYIQLEELGLPVDFSKRHRLGSDTIEHASQDVRVRVNRLNGFDKYVANNFLNTY